MKIRAVHITRVDFPQKSAKATAHNVLSQHARTIIRLVTDDGLTGLGECSGDPDIYRLACRIAESVIGMDIWHTNALRLDYAGMAFHQRNGRNGWIAFGGVETAFWDLKAKSLNRPLCDLFGGARRDRIPVVLGLGVAPLPPGASRADVEAMIGDLGNVSRVTENAQARVAEHRFTTIKIKSAAHSTAWDLAVITALRETFGPDMKLRIDPNAAYSPARAAELFPRLDPLELEFFEDPTADIEGMSRLRRKVTTPLATNMCVIQFDHIPPAVRLGAVDIVLGDVYHWGGVAAVCDLIRVCDALGLGFGIHSTLEGEWDIGTAVNLHLCAALPELKHAMDGNFPSPASGIATEPLEVMGGCISLPDGPGLGITLDEEKIGRLRLEEFRAEA